MRAQRFDVLIVGSGPAGSIAAIVLARGGARVALVDKASFPRDKACGDLVGPRGVQLLEDLDIPLPGSLPVTDMMVVGPTGRQVRLPAFAGETYPGHALALPRTRFDATLHAAAIAAGAEPFTGRAGDPLYRDDQLEGFVLSGGTTLRADIIIGADGATSRVADAAGLLDESRLLWGFALRYYIDQPVDLPQIVLWEPKPWQAYPGYGWLFPGPDQRANLGLGLGVMQTRSAAAHAARDLPGFVRALHRSHLLDNSHPQPPPRLGGWLKLGMVGTTPARGRVLLIGDAAGLVNPLQGEGIAPAMTSARAAAQAILTTPGDPTTPYRDFLATTFAGYHTVTATLHAALLRHPKLRAAATRVLTTPGIAERIAGGWSIFWNDLLDGATPGPQRRLAATVLNWGNALSRGNTRRWIDTTFPHEALAHSAHRHFPIPRRSPYP